MFCTEGYSTIAEVRCRVSDFQWNRGDNPDHTPSDVFENLVFDVILEADALRLCSPEGQILKISAEILDRIGVPKELRTQNFPSIYHYMDSVSDDCSLRWSTIPLFFDRMTYTVSLSEYRNLRTLALKEVSEEEIFEFLALGFEADPFWAIVERFEGYSLCAVSDRIPSEIRNWDGVSGHITSQTRGRPSQRKDIRMFYEAHFPKGHASWKEANAKLREVTGIDVHVDTLKRAIGQK